MGATAAATRLLAAARGAPAVVEIFLALLVNATRERCAAIDERLDLLDLHAGGPEPMSSLFVLRDNLHGSLRVDSLRSSTAQSARVASSERRTRPRSGGSPTVGQQRLRMYTR